MVTFKPFAHARFCAAEGIDRVITASDYKYHSFGEVFGTYIKELGLLTRAVIIADKNGIVKYTEYVNEVTHEPNYNSALDIIKNIV